MDEAIPLVRDKYAIFGDEERQVDGVVFLGRTPKRRILAPLVTLSVCLLLSLVFLLLGATLSVSPSDGPRGGTTSVRTGRPRPPDESLAPVFLPIMAIFLLLCVYPAYQLFRFLRSPIAMRIDHDKVLIVFVQGAKNLVFDAQAGNFSVEWAITLKTVLTAVVCFIPAGGSTAFRSQIGFGTCETAAEALALVKQMPNYEKLCRVLERELPINEPFIPVHKINDHEL